MLHFSYEKAGLTIQNQPIPWNAEAVLVEAIVKLTAITAEARGEFQLRLPGIEPIRAESLRLSEAGPTDLFSHFRHSMAIRPSDGIKILPLLDPAAFLAETADAHVVQDDRNCAKCVESPATQ